jgi:hypothetical protein
MSYMSYCRFEGVSGDLKGCINALNNECIENQSEEYYAKKIREMCEDYIRAYDNSIYNEDNQ